MANLDTASKRASALTVMRPWMLAEVLPDGTIEDKDRYHEAGAYSGLAATASPPGIGATYLSDTRKRRRLMTWWRRGYGRS